MKVMTSPAEFKILDDQEQRQELLELGLELLELIKDEGIETVVWLDRAARPFSWLTEELWAQHFPELPLPQFVYLNIGGEKNLRQRYMPDVGITDNNGNFYQQFVGVYDDEEKVELFEARVRCDKDAQNQLRMELGPEADSLFVDRKVLVVDHMEFEGVSRMYTEIIIDETYSPESVAYFEFGQECGGMPTGLDNPVPDPSFIAKETSDSTEVDNVRTLRLELRQLVLSQQVRIQ